MKALKYLYAFNPHFLRSKRLNKKLRSGEMMNLPDDSEGEMNKFIKLFARA